MEVFGLSGSGNGYAVKKNPLMNEIMHVTHHPVAVRDIFYCTGHIERGIMKNSMFIRNCIKGMMDEIYPRK